MDYVDYPQYQLEFIVLDTASPEPENNLDIHLTQWLLPEKENWQLYTPWDCVRMYDNAGMQLWEFVQGQNGLVAVLYRNSRENEYYNIGDMLLLDVFDRKTGIRYEVFSEPTVETESVIPYRDGFRIDSGNLQYCYVDDSGSIVLEPVDLTDSGQYTIGGSLS